ncbi:MAG: hypothetical protein AB2809_18015 [Candidatus Thiodiazotropha sp.]
MNDIVIEQCELRIRRSAATAAPWLDNDDHQALARRVQAIVLPMLEELLAPRLQERPSELITALRLGVTLSAEDLAGAAPLTRTGLRTRLTHEVETALSETENLERQAKIPPSRSETPRSVVHAASAQAVQAETSQAMVDILKSVFSSDRSESTISLFSEPQLFLVLARTLESYAISSGNPLVKKIFHADGTVETGIGDLSTSGRKEIINVLRELTELVSSGSADPSPERSFTQAAVPLLKKAQHILLQRRNTEKNRDLPRTERGNKATRTGRKNVTATGIIHLETPRNVDLSEQRSSGIDTGMAFRDGMVPGRYFLDHALPLLALAALARHGIVQSLALDTPHPAVAATIATGIALKTLPADKAQGAGAWSSTALRAAAMATGRQTKPVGGDFLAASSHVPHGGLFARSQVAAALIDSLSSGGALPLVQTGERFILLDPDGFYPIVAGSPRALVPFLLSLDRIFFLYPSDSKHWPILEAAGLAVVAEGAALRSEGAGPIIGPSGWHGHATSATRLHPGIHARLPKDAAKAAHAAKIWQQLGTDLPLVAHPAEDTRTLLMNELITLLAGFALSDMGWALYLHDPASWKEPDPMLVKKRFADLSGWLEVSATQVTVALPLGRRFTDLRNAGLLDTVCSLPGWPGRDIAFRGG